MRAARLARRAARLVGIDGDASPGRVRDWLIAHWRFGAMLTVAWLNAAIWALAIALVCAAADVEIDRLALMSCGLLVMIIGFFSLTIVASDRR